MYIGVSVQLMNMLDNFSFGNLFRKVNVEVFYSQISASFSLCSHIAFWILSVPYYHHCKSWNLKMKMMMRISREIRRGIYRERSWRNDWVTYLAVFLREETDLVGDFRSDCLCHGFAVDYGGHLIGEGCGLLLQCNFTNCISC